LKKRLALIPFLLIVSALVLSACGGGGSSDEGQIEEAIETSATSVDVSNCTELQTLKFDEQGAQTQGKGAVKACEKELQEPSAKANKAESVEVSNVEVNGSKATAEAAVTGGGFDGQTLEIDLAEEGGQWKLDELVAFTKFDGAKLVEALSAEFEKDESVEPKLAACIEEGFEEASQGEVEKLILGGSSKPIEELAEGCVS
jgi:hypothetical protein